MSDEELETPKGSPLKLLTTEDLSVHSVVVLKERIVILKNEICRSENEIGHKKDAHADANDLFN